MHYIRPCWDHWHQNGKCLTYIKTIGYRCISDTPGTPGTNLNEAPRRRVTSDLVEHLIVKIYMMDDIVLNGVMIVGIERHLNINIECRAVHEEFLVLRE